VDPSTLGLSVQVPIAGYPGRAGASLPVTLYYSSKQWRLQYDLSWTDIHQYTFSETHPVYAEHSRARWSSSLGVPYIEWTNSSQPYVGEGEPYCSGCPDQEGGPLEYFNRIHLHMPDGSTHELRLNDNEATAASFTGVFVAVDVSHIKYDADTQIVYLADGSQYRLDGASADSYYIDRNGNTLTYHYTTRKWSDALGRELELSLPASPAAQDYTYTLPSVNGGTVSYTVRWKHLGDSGVFSDAGMALNYPSLQCQGASTPAQSPHLFNNIVTTAKNHVCSGPVQFNPVVLYQIVLPNGKSYTFNYNEWGEIAKVSYPTGGYEKYAYGKIVGVARMEEPYAQANRGVIDRWTSPSGSGADEIHWQYASTGALTTTTAPDGSRTERAIYKANPYATALGLGLSDAKDGMSYEERAYSAGGTMLRRTLTEWATSGPTSGGYGSATRDARPVREVNIILDTGGEALATTTTMSYDADLNVSSTSHYGFVTLNSTAALTVAIGSVSNGSLLRTDETTYLVNDTAISSTTRTLYRNRNLLSLPTSARVKDSGGTIVAQSRISYDETTPYPLLTYSGAMVGWTDPSTNVRGLPTTSGAWLTGTFYLETHAQYDQFGNLRNSWDANGNQSQVAYSSTYNYAYPTSSSSAVPEPSGVHGSTVALTSSAVYHTNTGRVTSTVDGNSQTTSYTYDSLNRLSVITRPTGGGTTIYDYDDTPGSVNVRTRNAIDSSRMTDAYQYLDGLGRPVRTFVNEGVFYLTTDTQYNALGRVWRVSNPYRTSYRTDGVNPDGYWTTNGYDSLGRVTTVTTPDGAVVTSAYSGSTSTTLGPVVTVTDQAGKLRRSLTDALGRLVRVDEPDASNDIGVLGSVTAPNQATSYTYDVTGNLTGVTQGAQSRTFVYNPLGRLTSATNPESGTVSYVYDNNGNLTSKTDARSMATNFGYDALNRVMTRTYSNDSGVTPPVSYYYDNASLPSGAPASFARGYSTGRLVAVSYGASSSSGDYNGYDELGRVIRHVQQTDNVNYLTEATYYLNSALSTETYPSVPGASDRRTVSYSLDLAARLSSLASAATSYAPAASLNSVSYKAHGGLESETLGNSLIHQLTYNTRLQPTDTKLGTSGNPTSVLSLSNNYGTTDNNGNLKYQVNTIGSLAITDTFSYDSLNRLKSTVETTTSGTGWTENNSYDRYGNRGGGSLSLTFSTSPSNNRISNGGYSYDAVGNLQNDGVHAYTFDAENKISKVDTVPAYVYDGSGQRVRKLVGENLRFIYGIGGAVVAEFSGSSGALQKEYVRGAGGMATIESAAVNGNGTRYATSDHLGTPRVVTNASAAVVSRHDYKPFGEEMAANVAGRTTGLGYSVTDNVRQKFTSKERDNETGLDYFGARYYSSPQGRFTSVDPITITQYRLTNPQALNGYSYVANMPLRFTDPTGKDLQFKTEDDAKQAVQFYQKGLDKDLQKYVSYKKNDDGTLSLTVDAKVAKAMGSSSILGRLEAAASAKEVAVISFVKKSDTFSVVVQGPDGSKRTVSTSLARVDQAGQTLLPFESRDAGNPKGVAARVYSTEPNKTQVIIATDPSVRTPTQAILAETLVHFGEFVRTGNPAAASHRYPGVDQNEEAVVNEVKELEKENNTSPAPKKPD
jgi:RHS repeat-associated protein